MMSDADKTRERTDVVEIRVRKFFTSDEGVNAAPAITIIMNGAPTSWPDVMDNLIAGAGNAVKGIPLDGVRPMTRAEVDDFLKDEDDAE